MFPHYTLARSIPTQSVEGQICRNEKQSLLLSLRDQSLLLRSIGSRPGHAAPSYISNTLLLEQELRQAIAAGQQRSSNTQSQVAQRLISLSHISPSLNYRPFIALGDNCLPQAQHTLIQPQISTQFGSEPCLRSQARATTQRRKEVRPCKKTNLVKKGTQPASFPCRCRGLPDDHNPNTAYILIPIDVEHGQDLKCSHHICRNRGVRFRYCSVCRRPVAKRNFSTRHNHRKLKEENQKEENSSK